MDQQLIMRVVVHFDWVYEATGILYKLLFDKYPHVQSLFPGDLVVQRTRLARALLFLVENITQPDVFAPVLRELGEEHRKLGIRPVHFEGFGDSLIQAMSICAADRWSEEIEDAWRRVYWRGAVHIIEGIESTTGELPFWNATVVGHELRSADTAALLIRPDHPYPFLAGQHATIESPRLPHAWRRYSMASPPRQDGLLEFRVRAVGRQGVSAALVHSTAVGDELRLGPARGELVLAEGSTRDVLLIAGGTGLAAARALFAVLARRAGDQRRVRLLVGVGGDEAARDLADLEAIRRGGAQPQRLSITPVGGVGESDAWFVREAAARDGRGWVDREVYVSGSARMTHETLRILQELGVPVEQVHRDRY